nr:regulatory protein RecX [Eubacterium sp.]
MKSSEDLREKRRNLEEQLKEIELKPSSSYGFSDEEGKRATEKAMSLLAYKDRTRKELEERLYRAGFSEKASEEAVSYAEHYGYINDRRYVETYIMFQQGKRSRKEITYKLVEKGIARDLIREVFLEADYEGEEEAVERLLPKKLKGRSVSELSYEERQKVMAYFRRKGFDLNCVKNVFYKLDI